MIVTELIGGMGNQMFQYAVARHLAEKHETTVLMDTSYLLDRRPRENFVFRDYDLGIFNVQEKFAPAAISNTYGQNRSIVIKALQKIIKPKNLEYTVEKGFAFDPAILQGRGNMYLSGYWQSEKYFKGIESIIRNEFSLKIEPCEKVILLKKQLMNDNAVCLHVRRTDFVNNPAHGTMGMDYYQQAENLLLEKNNNLVIYVFSDDINWCKNNLALKSKTVFVEDDCAGLKASGHFTLMCQCKYFIIPNSSFSWWAAWLNNNPEKIVIAPKVWFLSGTLDTKDLLPENWIKI